MINLVFLDQWSRFRLENLHRGEKKEHPGKHTHTKLSRYDIVLRWPRSPGVGFGGEFAEGHLPYALRVRPQTKACHCKQDRQPDAPLSRGEGRLKARGGGCVWRLRVCLCVHGRDSL